VCFSTSFLHSAAIIDQTYETRRVMSKAIAYQYFGCFISMDKWADAWLTYGIANYLHGLYIRKTFGNNVYRQQVHQELTDVVRYESQYGGIVLDRRKVSLVDDIVRVQNPDGEGDLHFSTEFAATTSPQYSELFLKKAHLAVS
jgi:transcription initiation factor TFIID subunit 2